MPTPNVYATQKQPLFETLVPELESNEVDLLYVTDRQREDNESVEATYGYGRSPSLAYGSAIVALGDDLSWEELKAYSQSPTSATERLPLRLVSTTELGRFPATPYLFQETRGTDIELDPEVIEERARALSQARAEITRRLSKTPRKEVYVFVHGVGNTFEYAVETAAMAAHFLGREGVTIAYSWPAGRGGLFFYAYDRESGEFTQFHLKQFFRALASIPEIERIHVVAHSRGTDVVMTALTELVVEARAAGLNPLEEFRIANVVLLAPDIDFEIAMQRYVAEAVGPAFGRMTIYTNANDSAIGAAQKLFTSRVRLGSVQPEELTEVQKEALRRVANFDIIIYQGQVAGRWGHSYFLDNPAVSSDVLMLLRYGWPPGEDYRRPLEPLGEQFWAISDDYFE